MRTLKKTLSLLLAVALVLSLTVVGASAAYTGNKVDTLKDAADVGADYSEAVGVMVGLGIIEGYDDGTLRPETTYTREQAAKIIAYICLGESSAEALVAYSDPFDDVAADRWSAGYIAYCVSAGIIYGRSDTIFAPEEIPSSNGLQMGLRKYVCIKYPETPSAPPKSAAAHRRGRRTLHTMVCAALPAN